MILRAAVIESTPSRRIVWRVTRSIVRSEIIRYDRSQGVGSASGGLVLAERSRLGSIKVDSIVEARD